MASNLTISYPPAVGAAAPPTELVAFDNGSSSTQDSLLNQVSGSPAVTNPVTSYPDPAEQYVKGQSEYPR